MIVEYCDRCGQEMSGPSGVSRFIAMQDWDGLASARRVTTEKVPPLVGVPFTLVGRKAAILHICGDCGASLLYWLANPHSEADRG